MMDTSPKHKSFGQAEGRKYDTAGYLFLHFPWKVLLFLPFCEKHIKGDFKMKKTLKITFSALLAVLLLFCTVSCAEKVDATGLWVSAKYLSDTTLGEGENTVKVSVVAEEQSVTFTLKTDKETLGEALYEHELVNDPSFFDTCNGIKADWDKDKAYWAFHVDGELAMHGINDEKITAADEHEYKIIYTK